MPKILKINDAAWLLAESHRTPMQVGMLATFTMPEDAREPYLEDLVSRWRDVRSFQPPFNYLLHGRGLPRWRLAQGFSVALEGVEPSGDRRTSAIIASHAVAFFGIARGTRGPMLGRRFTGGSD